MWRRFARYAASLLAAAEVMTSVYCPVFAETIDANTCAYGTVWTGMASMESGGPEGTLLPEDAETVPMEIPAEDLFLPEETMTAAPYAGEGEVISSDAAGTVVPGPEDAMEETEAVDPYQDAGIPGAEEGGIQESVNEGCPEDGIGPETVNEGLAEEAAVPQGLNQEFSEEADPEDLNQGFTEETADPEGVNQEFTDEADPEDLNQGFTEETADPESVNESFAEEAADPEGLPVRSGEDTAGEAADPVDWSTVDAEAEVREDIVEGTDAETAEEAAETEAEDGEPGPEEESDAIEASDPDAVLSETEGQDGSAETGDSILPETSPAQMTESEPAMEAGLSTVLSEPSGLSVSRREDGDYTLSWKAVSGASRYQIYVYNRPTKKWVEHCCFEAEEGCSYLLRRDMLDWGENKYTISALDEADRESAYGKNTVSVYSIPQTYGRVETDYSVCRNKYTFSSEYDETQVSGVEIYRSLDSGDWAKIKDLSVSEFEETSTTIEDADIAKAGIYRYRARFYYTTDTGRKYGAYSETVMEEIRVPDADGIYPALEGSRVRVKISHRLFYLSDRAFDSLEVYRKTKSGTWGKIKTFKRSELQVDDSYCSAEFMDSISGSGTYQYRFRFCLGTSKGIFSETERIYYLKNPVLKSYTTKANKITLKWTGDDQATGWHIELVDNSNGYVIKKIDLAAGKTGYTIDLNKVENVPDYYSGSVLLLRIYADNKNTSSDYSTRKCIFLVQPRIRGAVSTSSSSVGLTWKKINGASGYKIYRYNTGKKKYDLVGTVKGASKTSFTDKKRAAKRKYTYRIMAFRKIGSKTYTSALSNVCDVWTLPKKSAVRIVNTLAGKKIKPQIRRSGIRVKDYLWADGGQGGSWSYCSEISDMIDYKGYYTIVYPAGNYLIIRRMKPGNLKVVKTLKIKKKYEETGGVICDAKGNYYVAWGKPDQTEKGTTVTFALSKYDYSGKHKGTCTYKGKSINTMIPFSSGNCAMTIDKGLLVCHFASKMYQSSDGLHHQASQYCIVNTKTMKKADPGDYFNYASHSFDQRILTRKDGGVLYTDLGDAYPRGIKLSESGAEGLHTTPFHFHGEIGNNYINAQLGDVVELSTGYMVVGASGKSLKSLNGQKQLFIQIINPVTGRSVLKAPARKGTSCGKAVQDTGVKWLTNYSDGSFVYNVQAAGMEGDRVVIMWERAGKYNSKTGTNQIGTYYMVVSASGTVLQKATRISKQEEIKLNGSEELKYKKGNVYWSTCRMDKSGRSSILTYKMNVTEGMGVIPDEVVMKAAKKSGKGFRISWKKARNATQYYVYRKLGKNGKWKKLTVTKSLSCTDQTAKAGKTYYYTVKGYNAKKKVFGDMNAAGVLAK